jgi:hypothetical protein
MGWRVNSPTFYIAPGATVRIDFWWGHPGDKGAQWAMGHPMKGEPPTSLATERVSKEVNCEIGVVVINGPPMYGCGDPETAYWVYHVDIHNEGANGCRFQLEGGGV